ncbi:hypothetical protein DL769_010720 [Monosporascus sp. CRB-8-3]|nr:hypothetical protein DL769_010720 [Monosporascus sp. CRB-8-3]
MQFKFSHPADSKNFWGAYLGDDCPLDEALYYTDPFYAECRAYGRIQNARVKGQIGKREKIAVGCHGYLLLKEKDKRRLEKMGLDLCSDVIDDDLRQALGQDVRIRAIVKDLEVDRRGLNSKNIHETFRRVTRLNYLKIYNNDIRAENFMNCRLVDFGRAWTEPHAILKAMDEVGARTRRRKDRVNFDEMIEDEGIKTTLKALLVPGPEYQLRSRGEPEWANPKLPQS